MLDALVLNINVIGENVMGQPLLEAHGFAQINGKFQSIKIETPVTSVKDVLDAIKDLFKET